MGPLSDHDVSIAETNKTVWNWNRVKARPIGVNSREEQGLSGE